MSQVDPYIDVSRHGSFNFSTKRYSDGESVHACGLICSVGAI